MAALDSLGSTDHVCNTDLTDFLNDDDEYDLEARTLINESRYFDINPLTSKIQELNGNFTLLCINIQCIHAKWDLLVATLDILKEKNIYFSAIALQETWLNDDPGIYELPNYNSFHLPRTCSNHGSLTTFIRSDYDAKQLDIYTNSQI